MAEMEGSVDRIKLDGAVGYIELEGSVDRVKMDGWVSDRVVEQPIYASSDWILASSDHEV